MEDISNLIEKIEVQIKYCKDKISNTSKEDKKEELYNNLNSLLYQKNKWINIQIESNNINNKQLYKNNNNKEENSEDIKNDNKIRKAIKKSDGK